MFTVSIKIWRQCVEFKKKQTVETYRMVPGTTLQVVPVSPEQLNNQNDVVCIVQDETLLVHDWRASKFHINLPRSTTVHDLYVHTGKEFKYEENSFLLVWKRSATGQSEEEVELKDDLENMTLQDVGLPPEKKKQRFYLRQKEGCNPVSTNLGIQVVQRLFYMSRLAILD